MGVVTPLAQVSEGRSYSSPRRLFWKAGVGWGPDYENQVWQKNKAAAKDTKPTAQPWQNRPDEKSPVLKWLAEMNEMAQSQMKVDSRDDITTVIGPWTH